jgi:phosphoglycerol transferase MdoB-like AlkP superfamily enzyme
MTPPPSLIMALWQSFRSMPAWVQIWVVGILVPVNMASLFFMAEPLGYWVAGLANVGMILNLPVMIWYRGFSRAMALPHLVPWTALVILIAFFRPDVSGCYDIYLWILLVTNVISLAFDYVDAVRWFRGERDVAGR